jgi:DNA-binding CsgD family transcriptional regulator
MDRRAAGNGATSPTELLYEAVLSESQLLPGLEALRASVGATALAYIAYSTQAAPRIEAVHVDLDTQALYEREFYKDDLRVPAALGVDVGKIFTEQSLVDPREFKKSAIRAFLTKHDIPFIMGTWVAKAADGTSASTLAFQRSVTAGAFSSEECRQSSELILRAAHALRIRETLIEERSRANNAYLALDRLPFAVILFAEDQSVVHVSEKARALLSGPHSILQYEGRRLRARQTEVDASLQLALLAATRGRPSDNVRYGSMVMVSKGRGTGGGHARLALHIAPLFEANNQGRRSHSCMLIAFDSHFRDRLSLPLVQMTLGLTRAEAALACALFRGHSLREAAAELGITANTCKSHLKRIYQKTGCRSHAGLVKTLISMSLPALTGSSFSL